MSTLRAVASNPSAGSGGGGAGVSAGAGVVTVPGPAGRYEHTENIVDAAVTAAKKIMVWLSPALDTDENDPEMLAVDSIAALAKNGSFDVTMTFPEPTSGPIKFNYMAV